MHMRITSLLLIILFLCVPTGAQGLDLGGLLNSAIQEAIKNAGQPTPARQPQNSVPPQQGDATVRDRQPSSSAIHNQPNNQSSSQGNISSSSNESSSHEIKVVEVEGVGESQQKAKEDAYRNAVEKAVGSFVSADLVAKNDQLIKDEVLNYSAGYIETSEVLSEGKRPDGLYSIKLRASVAKKKLTRQLEALNIATADVDSESIFAEAVTTSNQRESAQKIWAKLFEDFWSKAFQVEVSGKPQLVYGPNDDIQAFFKVVVRFNRQFLEETKDAIKGTGNTLMHGEVGSLLSSASKHGFTRICLVENGVYSRYDTEQLRDQYDFPYQEKYKFFIPKTQANFMDRRYSIGDGLCAAIPITMGSWGQYGNHRRFVPQVFTSDSDSQLQKYPHIQLTLFNKQNESVASAKGLLVIDAPSGNQPPSAYFILGNVKWGGNIDGENLIIMGDRVDVRYIPVKLKRNQLQEISKVEVRAVGKLIYDDSATSATSGKKLNRPNYQ